MSGSTSRRTTVGIGRWRLAPLEGEGSIARACVAIAPAGDGVLPSFVRIAETRFAIGLLGCIADAALVPRTWVVLWLARAPVDWDGAETIRGPIPNAERDALWRLMWAPWTKAPGREDGWISPWTDRPAPVLLIDPAGAPAEPVIVPPSRRPLELCTNDELLVAHGLPAYSTTSARLLATQPDDARQHFVWLGGEGEPPEGCPTLVDLTRRSPDRLLFNAGVDLLGAGPLVITRYHPVGFSDLAALLRGEPPQIASDIRSAVESNESIVSPLLSAWIRAERASRKSPIEPGRLFGIEEPAGWQLLEACYLRLRAVTDMLEEVAAATAASDLPLFNLQPASFAAELERASESLPFLWQTRLRLVRPGDARLLRLPEDPSLRIFARPTVSDLDTLAPTRAITSFGAECTIREERDAGNGRVQLRGHFLPREPIEVLTTDLLRFPLPVGGQRITVLATATADVAGRKRVDFETLPIRVPASGSERQAAQVRTAVEVLPREGSPHDMYAIFVLGCRLLLAGCDPLGAGAAHTAREARTIEALAEMIAAANESTEPGGVRERLARALEQNPSLLAPELLPAAPRPAMASAAALPADLPVDLWSDVLWALAQLRPGWPGARCKDFGDFSSEFPAGIFDTVVGTFRDLAFWFRARLLGQRLIDREIRGVADEVLGE